MVPSRGPCDRVKSGKLPEVGSVSIIPFFVALSAIDGIFQGFWDDFQCQCRTFDWAMVSRL